MVNVIVSTNGTSGPRGNGWLSGTGVPTNVIGFDGDFYIDLNDPGLYYGPKANGMWPVDANSFAMAQNNVGATVPPTVDDDETLGYEVLSFWVDNTANLVYVCSDAATGAAIWTAILPVGTTAGTVAAGDDSRIVNALQNGDAAGGGLSGTYPSPTVIAIRNVIMNTQVPNPGDVATATSATTMTWAAPASTSPTGPAGGDLSGTYPNPGVAAVDGVTVTGTPATGQFLTATGTTSASWQTYNAPTELPPTGPAGGDLDGTYPDPLVINTHLASPLPVNQGGTGSSTQNFVDLTTAQSIGGIKTFTDEVIVPTPVGQFDAVTKEYADALATGIVIKQQVDLGTAVALPANTYVNGASGVGATLTGNAVGVLTVDGVAVVSGNRVLVKNESNAAHNGIYLCTTQGTVSVAYVLTRTTDFDQPAEIPNAATFVTTGTVNDGTGWAVIGGGPYVIGTTNIVWTQISSPGLITAGHGLQQVGNEISLITPVATGDLSAATTSSSGIAQFNGVNANIAPLGTQDAGATGLIADAGHVHPTTGLVRTADAATTVTAETVYGQSSVVGTAVTFAREDHSHGSPALTATPPATTLAIGTAAAVGVATTPARADHVHPMSAAGVPGSSAVGDTPSTGNATTFAASNHVHGRETFGAVTALSAFNTPSSNGTATTVSHSDHVHGAPALPSATPSVLGVMQLTGDLTGTATSPVVAKVNGTSVPATPITGQVLTATSGTSATWQNPTTAGAAGGDLSGTYPNPTVSRVNGVTVSGTPVANQNITATSGSTATWTVLPHMASSGILNGAVMTLNSGAIFNVSAGTGYIVDYVTSPTVPVITTVTISAQSVTLTGAALTRVVNWWLADSAGVITSQATAPTAAQRRTAIVLGTTWSVTGTGALYNVMSTPTALNQPTASLFGFMASLGTFSVSGNAISANGANLNINKSVGTLFAGGFGYGLTGANNPNQVTAPAETALTMRYVTQLTNSESATRTTIDVANYDVAGTITAIPGGGGTSSIHRVFIMPTGVSGSQVMVQYGQATYSSLANAVAAIGTEPFVLNPDIDAVGTLVCYLACTKSATQLNNTGQATFRTAARFALP